MVLLAGYPSRSGDAALLRSSDFLRKSRFGMGEPDEKALEGPLKDIAQFLAVLDENLSDKEWVAGELSIADFAVASTFVYRKGSRNTSSEHVPHVSTWIDRLEERSSWKAAVRPVLELPNT